jgi:hypothetical protein
LFVPDAWVRAAGRSRNVQHAHFGRAERLVFWLFGARKTKKNTFFKKQSGGVIDNTGSGTKNKPEQTEKQSGEVVENTFLWKKQTGKQTGPCC